MREHAPRSDAPPAVATLFLETPPEAGALTRIRGEEAAHARARRLRVGDPCVGVDGAGRRWPLVLRATRGGGIEVEGTGPAESEPAPGEAGAPLPWVEVAVSWPRRNRASGMLGALVQLGCAAITPLGARQRGAEPCPDLAEARWARLTREALKQCGRAWLPELHPALEPAALPAARPGAVVAVLEPGAGMSFDTWLRSLTPAPVGVGSRERPIVLAIGPEGGFTSDEREAFALAGASSVWLAPHVLRIETAAVAAMALAACTLGGPRT